MVDQFKNSDTADGKAETRSKHIVIAAVVLAIIIYFVLDQAWPLLIALFIAVGAIVYLIKPNDRQKLVVDHASTSETTEATLAAMIDALQYPAYILDQRGAVKFANKASNKIFGKHNIGDLITIRFRQPDLSKFIEKALKTLKPMRTNYSEPVPHDRWFAVEIAPIGKLSSPAPLFMLGFHDLTDAKRTEQMRSDFIANASHELRTPIASLLGYIETIRGAAKNDKKATERFLGIMQDQAERMTRLVNDLLSLSRIEMKSHVQPSEQVNLVELVHTVVRSLDELAKQAKIKISFEAPKEVFIIGDRDELIQVFENLIENACKYGDQGKKVDVKILKGETGRQKSVTVSVRDYGPGIAIEDQQRITERFYRVDVARSREKQGTGLGLAIVKHILNRHQVRLVVKSKLDEGAEFSVTFPTLKNVNK